MKLFAISDIHGATKPIEKAAPLIRESDWVVIAGDITHTKTRWLPIRAALRKAVTCPSKSVRTLWLSPKEWTINQAKKRRRSGNHLLNDGFNGLDFPDQSACLAGPESRTLIIAGGVGVAIQFVGNFFRRDFGQSFFNPGR